MVWPEPLSSPEKKIPKQEPTIKPRTAKGTVKTAQHTSKTAIKTADHTAKAAQKTAQATAKAAKMTSHLRPDGAGAGHFKCVMGGAVLDLVQLALILLIDLPDNGGKAP